MRLKEGRGMTAMVDAMIFIIVMGIAISALFAFTGDKPMGNDALSVSDNIFSAKLKVNDFIETDESGLIGMPDMAAFYILTGEGNALEYIQSILDSLTQRPGSYSLKMEYRGEAVTIGNGEGESVSGSVKEYAVTYGGTIRVDLRFY
ncbi:MAG: hypothetical protein FWG41_05230 [Methanomassiliicoccaceae archaeon]|nr:hypothetical protein [Methanomassiliicoccaceae archaeon]